MPKKNESTLLVEELITIPLMMLSAEEIKLAQEENLPGDFTKLRKQFGLGLGKLLRNEESQKEYRTAKEAFLRGNSSVLIDFFQRHTDIQNYFSNNTEFLKQLSLPVVRWQNGLSKGRIDTIVEQIDKLLSLPSGNELYQLARSEKDIINFAPLKESPKRTRELLSNFHTVSERNQTKFSNALISLETGDKSLLRTLLQENTAICSLFDRKTQEQLAVLSSAPRPPVKKANPPLPSSMTDAETHKKISKIITKIQKIMQEESPEIISLRKQLLQLKTPPSSILHSINRYTKGITKILGTVEKTKNFSSLLDELKENNTSNVYNFFVQEKQVREYSYAHLPTLDNELLVLDTVKLVQKLATMPLLTADRRVVQTWLATADSPYRTSKTDINKKHLTLFDKGLHKLFETKEESHHYFAAVQYMREGNNVPIAEILLNKPRIRNYIHNNIAILESVDEAFKGSDHSRFSTIQEEVSMSYRSIKKLQAASPAERVCENLLDQLAQMPLVTVEPAALHAAFISGDFLNPSKYYKESQEVVRTARDNLHLFSYGLKELLGSDEKRAEYRAALQGLGQGDREQLREFLFENKSIREYIDANLSKLEVVNGAWEDYMRPPSPPSPPPLALVVAGEYDDWEDGMLSSSSVAVVPSNLPDIVSKMFQGLVLSTQNPGAESCFLGVLAAESSAKEESSKHSSNEAAIITHISMALQSLTEDEKAEYFFAMAALPQKPRKLASFLQQHEDLTFFSMRTQQP